MSVTLAGRLVGRRAASRAETLHQAGGLLQQRGLGPGEVRPARLLSVGVGFITLSSRSRRLLGQYVRAIVA